MIKDNAVNKLIRIAKNELGYHEQGENCTKYAMNYDYDDRLYGWDLNGQPWCAYFVSWCFIEAFGYEKGSQMTYQYSGCSGAACANSAEYYQSNGAFSHTPEKGDQIFFYYGGAINHTGIVVEVTGNQIITVEGNSSDMVAERTYNINDGTIAGYGKPNWSIVSEVKEDEDDVHDSDNSGSSIYIKDSSRDVKFSRGDVVKVIGMTYCGGELIPDWVKAQNWIVFGVYKDGRRIVIDEAEDGSDFIMSPLYPEDLELVRHGNSKTYVEYTTYTVQTGDNLWKIALKQLGSGLRYKEIKELNKLGNEKLYPGQILKIPQE